MSGREVSVAAEALLEGASPPLPAYLGPLLAWHEVRHLQLLEGEGFADVRRAHNAVFMHLPAEGLRLTELAASAGMTKQAMGELVDDLVAKGYLRRDPDPADGRAKLIGWAPRGEAAHEATLRAFSRLDDEVLDVLGADRFEQFVGMLAEVVATLVLDSGSD